MKNINKYFLIFLVVSIGLIPFVPSFRTIDMSAPQYLYLSFTQLLISIYLILIKKEDLIKLNFIDISYIIFLFFSLVSFFKSINLTESIVEFSQFLTLFITYFNLKILLKDLPKKQHIFLTFFTVLATIESLVILSVFIENYSFDFGIGRVKILEGLSSNLNISAFSLLIKVPFLIYIISKASTLYYKFAITLILSIVVFCIVILASRGALIGLFIILIGLLIFEIYKKNRKEFRFKLSSIFISILSFVFVLQYSLYTKNTELISLNRISNLIDTSSSDRIDYYKTAIELFSENPILGVGIGNWKIVSIKNLGSKLYDYTIPYHVHNDILQIFSETGLIGGISFFMLLMLPVIFLIKYCWDKRSLNEIAPFLLLAFIIHLLDSNLNFPRIRPFNQMNFIFLLSFFTSHFHLKNFNKPIKIRKVSFIFIFMLLPLNILHTKFLLSYQEIYNLHVDFNTNSNKLQGSIEVIKKYQETYPNITNTTIPIKDVKANYYIQSGDYDKAEELINKSKNVNPFLGFGDYLKAKIFYAKGIKDSAFYYSEKAYLKIPKNVAHAVLYQSLLFEQKNYSRLQEVFQETKVLRNELIWQNHFSAVISENNKDVNNSFSSNDKTDIKTAIILFPKNILFKSFDLIINQGQNASTLAIKYDITAKKYYAEKKYQDAIEYWEKASKIVVNEDSYILNSAFSYSILENYNKSLEYLKIIESKNIKSNDGFFEFIAGYNFLKQEKFNEACEYFRAASSMGYINAKSFLTQVNCQTNY